MEEQRNESSVLFSLANLRALGTSTPGSRRGQAQSNEGAVDDLLSIGSGGSPFAPTLGGPILAPARHTSGNRGPVIGMGLGATAVVVAAALVVVVFLAKDGNGTLPVVTALDVPAATTQVVVVPPVGAMPPPAATASAELVVPTRQGHELGAPTPDERESSSNVARRPRVDRRHENAVPAAPHPAPGDARIAATRSPTDAVPQSPRPESMDEILARIRDSSREPRPAPAPSTDVALPEQPSRDQVRAALSTVQRATAACGVDQHGLAMTALTVSGSSGRVTRAVVSGQFAGTPVGSCVARAAREARFPPFRNASFSVSFPFSL